MRTTTTNTEEREYAESRGATAHPDHNRGKDWSRYELNGWHLWQCVHDGRIAWAAARLEDGSYCKHHYRPTLAEALDFAAEWEPTA